MESSTEQITRWRERGMAWCRLHPLTSIAVPLAVLIVVAAGVYVFVIPPASFPRGTSIVVPEGASVIQTASLLEDAGALRSPFLFRMLVSAKGVQAGAYVFESPQNLVSLSIALMRGTGGVTQVRVTIPEGFTVREMAEVFSQSLTSFDTDAFVEYAAPYEGYLFPDTYFFSPFVTAREVVDTLRGTFDARMQELRTLVTASPYTQKDIVIMASLLEKEAKTLEEKKMIAGILWKRIAIDMPLQVDAVFGYIKGIDTFHPSLSDLEIESPYNTYRNRGLPPTPIANPGIESLTAAATPVTSDYLYYLTGRDGVMRYARTFDEHKANRAKYLD